MIPPKIKSWWQRGWISFGAVSAAFTYLMHVTWLKWGDLIVDAGREMYVPAVLSKGAVLYRDIFYLYGQFSPYFHAMLFRIYGVHLNSLIFSGAVTAAVTVFLIYKISRMFLNIALSTLTALVFLFVCAFGHYLFLANYNFIIPYSYPAVHAMMFALGALYFFFRFARRLTPGNLYISACLVFLCLVTRVELGLMLVLALAAGNFLLKIKGRQDSSSLSWLALIGIPVVLGCLVYGGFWAASDGQIQQSKLLAFLSTNTLMDNPFTSWLSGMNQWGENIMLIMKSLFFYVLLGLWFFCGGFFATLAQRIKDGEQRRILFVAVAVVFLGLAYLFMHLYFGRGIQYRGLPVLIVLALILSLMRISKSDDPARAVMLITLSVFGLLVLLRILLNVHPMHYGFTLLAPGLIVYHVLFFDIVPRSVAQPMIRRAITLGFAFMAAVFAFQHAAASQFAYRHHEMQLVTPRGSMKLLRTLKDASCASLVQYLASRTPPDATVAVFPEGLGINFLAGRENPLYYYSYMPPDFAKANVEAAVIADIEKNKLDYIVLLQRDLSEYQMNVFGADYAKDLWQYVLKYYRLEDQLGNFPYTSPDFGVAILKRKDISDAAAGSEGENF